MKDIKKILIIILSLNIILCILLIGIYSSKIKKESKEVQAKGEPTAIQEEKKLYPAGSFKFTYSYDGENDIDEFYTKINTFVNYIGILKKDVNSVNLESINTYFNNNKKQIQEITGITEAEQFKKLIDQISKCNVEEQYDKIEMINDTYEKNDSECSIQINITYKNGNTVKIIATFLKAFSTEQTVKFKPV